MKFKVIAALIVGLSSVSVYAKEPRERPEIKPIHPTQRVSFGEFSSTCSLSAYGMMAGSDPFFKSEDESRIAGVNHLICGAMSNTTAAALLDIVDLMKGKADAHEAALASCWEKEVKHLAAAPDSYMRQSFAVFPEELKEGRFPAAALAYLSIKNRIASVCASTN